MTDQFHNRVAGAFLGGAIGDALGWPNEPAGRNVAARDSGWQPDRSFELSQWTRFAGSRFRPFEDRINAGEYSDDTQLTLAVARARLHGGDWLDHLVEVELPAWLAYERGGGRTVKEASRSWQSGRPPWDDSTKTASQTANIYFGSGANGAAMRVLAHAVVHRSSSDFRVVAADVIADARSTHGHPRALIGATLQAFGLWEALRHTGTLDFGHLHRRAAESVEVWGAIPDKLSSDLAWNDAFRRHHAAGLPAVWEATIEEAVELLAVVSEALDQGPLNNAVGTLHRLGCQDPRQNGSGTVCATAALFLASRFAASPATGLIEAAALPDGDTDTLAAMVGALLGATHGLGWLDGPAATIEDADYLHGMARHLIEIESPARRVERVSTTAVSRWREALMVLPPDGTLEFLDRRPARSLGPVEELQAADRGFVAAKWTMRTGDGQTLRVIRTRKRDPKRTVSQAVTGPSDPIRVARAGIRLPIVDLNQTRRFYEERVGFTPTRTGNSLVNYFETLTFTVSGTRVSPPDQAQSIFIETADLDDLERRLAHAGVPSTTINLGDRRRGLRIRDPDGYNVDLFQPPARADASP